MKPLRRHTQSIALTACAILLALTSSTFLLDWQFGRSAEASSSDSARLAYFYVPPNDGTSVEAIASSSDFIILNGDKQSYTNDLRSNGYTGDVVQYLLAAEVGGPGPFKDSSAWCDSNYQGLQNNVANERGEFCLYIHPNESWFLHNGNGERLYSTWGSRVLYHMNPASSGWRAFARSQMEDALANNGFDGFFFDNVSLSITKVQSQLNNSDGVVQEHSSNSSYRSAWTGYLSYLSDRLRTDGNIVWANMIADPNDGSSWDSYMQYLDGGMNESWATGYSSDGLAADKWENNLAQTERTLQAGKGVITLGQGSETDSNRQRFLFASYLLIDQPDKPVYMRYAKDGQYNEFWWYSNYELELGAPLAGRYQSGGNWKRDFQCGSVTVDPAARSATISTSDCGASGTTPTPQPAPPTATMVPPTATATATVPPSPSAIIFNGISNGQTVVGDIFIEVTSSNPDNIDKVEFYVDGKWTWYEGQPPYFLGGDSNGQGNGFDTLSLTDGYHYMIVKVTDYAGKTEYGTLTFVVSNASQPAPTATASVPTATATPPPPTATVTPPPPTATATPQPPTPTATPTSPAPDVSDDVAITGISDGDAVSGNIVVEVVAAPSVEIGRVRFYLDGRWVGQEGVGPYYLGGDDDGSPRGFDTRKWSNGSHILEFRVTFEDRSEEKIEFAIEVRN